MRQSPPVYNFRRAGASSVYIAHHVQKLCPFRSLSVVRKALSKRRARSTAGAPNTERMLYDLLSGPTRRWVLASSWHASTVKVSNLGQPDARQTLNAASLQTYHLLWGMKYLNITHVGLLGASGRKLSRSCPAGFALSGPRTVEACRKSWQRDGTSRRLGEPASGAKLRHLGLQPEQFLHCFWPPIYVGAL